MKMNRILSLVALLVAASTATTASAHTGHGTHSLLNGLSHPLGLDHLLAMVAVGTWSAVALQGARRWAWPCRAPKPASRCRWWCSAPCWWRANACLRAWGWR